MYKAQRKETHIIIPAGVLPMTFLQSKFVAPPLIQKGLNFSAFKAIFTMVSWF
jgi:hypothetical protein